MAGIGFDDLPNEMLFEIFSFLDLAAFRNARLVCKKWKIIVIETHPKFHFVVPLTDKSMATIDKLTETQVSIHVHNFTGKGNKMVSGMEGAGFLFVQAEKIKFEGDNVEPAEILKLMPYAFETVRVLSFVNLGSDVIIRPFLGMTATFRVLRKLEIVTRLGNFTFKRSPRSPSMFHCYTSMLQRLAALDSGLQMPLLESLTLSFNPRFTRTYNAYSTENMFANFLAIAKLILKFRRTLRKVEIDFTGSSDGARNPLWGEDLTLSQAELTEMQECIDTFKELVNLNRISCRSVNVRDNPWDWELQLLQRPRNLTELHIVSPKIDGLEYYDFPELLRLFPENRHTLTSVKIVAHRPNDHADLGVFGTCPNLNTLWLEFYVYPESMEPLRLTNLDKLPRKMISFHLKSNRMHDRRRQHVILSREQIRWIVDNIKCLKSFWAQLVLQTTDNQNNAGNANGNNARQRRQRRQPQPPDVVRSASNIDLELFRDIMNMPKISDLKFDLLKARNLSHVIPVEEIRKYSEMYKCVPNITTTCRTFPDDYDHLVTCTELTIKIN